MHRHVFAGLILTLASQARAQTALPHFVFNGHRAGEAEAAAVPSGPCKMQDAETRMCTKEEEVAGKLANVTYSYRSQRLSSLHVKVDSGTAFEPLLAAFTTQYGKPRALRRGGGIDYAQWRFAEGQMDLTRTGTLVIASFRATSARHAVE